MATPLRSTWGAAALSCIAATVLSGATRDPEVHAADRGALLGQAAPVRIAVTFDDLPVSGATLPDWPAARIMHSLRATLLAHHVPGAVGFFTGANLDGTAASVDALRAWCDAGFPLANHSYAHVGADRSSPSHFLADAQLNQALLDSLVGPSCSQPRYYRFPGLLRGSGPHAAQIEADLARAGFRVADVSLDFADWAHTDSYVRCLRSGDDEGMAAVRDSFMENALAELSWSVETARQLFARDIPHVLLLHSNVLTAHQLDALLSAYEARGARFVTLDEALADPAYGAAEAGAHGDGKLLESSLRARGLPMLRFIPEPLGLLRVICREGAEAGDE
jgi:peptidoglycan/xylan/chitin deacetylase (PgdA/CDA1 family)